MSREDGISEVELAALAEYETGSFSNAERAALAYAEALTLSNTIPDPLFERLREHFSEDEIVELTAVITWEICAAKFNRALQIEAQGICLIPGPLKAKPARTGEPDGER